MPNFLLGGNNLGQPVTNFIQTMEGIQNSASVREIQVQQARALKMAAEQAEKDNYEWHPDTIIASFPKEYRPIIQQMLPMTGIIQPNGLVRGKDARGLGDKIKEFPEIEGSLIQTQVGMWQKALEKPDIAPQEKDALLKQVDAAHKRLAELAGTKEKEKSGYTLKENEIRFGPDNKEVARGVTKKTGRMIPVYDPSSPTEYSYGNPETGELSEMAAPPPKAAAEKSDPFNVWLNSYIESTGRKPSAQEVMDWHRASAVNINLNKDAAKEVIKTLPEQKAKAESSANAITRIDKMLGLIERGAGGRLGQAKAWIAPILEAVGYKSQGLAEAQMYETLAKTLGGSMRMEIVGPGVVSDYEQKLLEKVSAGGATATDAARELLQYYRGVAEKNIKSYNQSVEGVAVEAPNAPRMFPPVQPNAPAQKQVIRYDSKGNRIP